MNIHTISAALAVLTLAGTINPSPAYAAKTCQTMVEGTGQAKANTLLARARAEQDWSKVANNTHGSWHGIWLKAEQRSMTCTITGKFPKTHACVARAQPCK